jgi:hypothetical protein
MSISGAKAWHRIVLQGLLVQPAGGVVTNPYRYRRGERAVSVFPMTTPCRVVTPCDLMQ